MLLHTDIFRYQICSYNQKNTFIKTFIWNFTTIPNGAKVLKLLYTKYSQIHIHIYVQTISLIHLDINFVLLHTPMRTVSFSQMCT